MGQARRRGTYEERKAAAIKRDAIERAEREEERRQRIAERNKRLSPGLVIVEGPRPRRLGAIGPLALMLALGAMNHDD